jgi:hypothetical protein
MRAAAGLRSAGSPRPGQRAPAWPPRPQFASRCWLPPRRCTATAQPPWLRAPHLPSSTAQPARPGRRWRCPPCCSGVPQSEAEARAAQRGPTHRANFSVSGSSAQRTPYVARMKRSGVRLSEPPAYSSTAAAASSVARSPEGSAAMAAWRAARQLPPCRRPRGTHTSRPALQDAAAADLRAAAGVRPSPAALARGARRVACGVLRCCISTSCRYSFFARLGVSVAARGALCARLDTPLAAPLRMARCDART